jgi:hypothetical protein
MYSLRFAGPSRWKGTARLPVFNVAQFVVKAKFGRPYALLEI